MQKSSQEQESERYLARKISKSHFYFKKNPKKSEGLQGNFSGGSQNSLKKSLFFVQKNLKKSFFVPKNLKKSFFCPKRSQKVIFMSIRCEGWVADAVPLQRSSMSESQNVAKKSQGGSQMRYLCNIAVCLRISITKEQMKCFIDAVHVSCCVCDICSLYIFVNNVFAFHCNLSSF